MTDEQIIIARNCPLCNTQRYIQVSKDAYNNWKNGTTIQKAFPDLTVDERELIMTGFCSKCFDTVMEPDDG